VLDIYFKDNETVAFSWEEAITIEETGLYYLWFVICDAELSAARVAHDRRARAAGGRQPGAVAERGRRAAPPSPSCAAQGRGRQQPSSACAWRRPAYACICPRSLGMASPGSDRAGAGAGAQATCPA